MKKLHLLIQERADLRKEGLALCELLKTDDRDPTTEEQATLDELESKCTVLDTDILKISKQNERASGFEGRDDLYLAPAQAINHEEEGRAGFRDIADYAIAVRNTMDPSSSFRDERLMAGPGNQEQGTSNAFMVPATFSETIFELEAEDMESGTNLFSQTFSEVTSRNQVTKPSDDSTPWGATGIQARWRVENTQLDESFLHTETIDVKLDELYAFATATEELLEDAPLLNSRLQRGARNAIQWKLDESIYRGDGVGKLQGFLESPALVTQAKESGQAADTVIAANVLNMYTRMLPSSLNRSRWLANIDIMPQLSTMTIGDQPVYLPPAGLAAAPHGLLMGRPIQYTEHADTLGNVGDLVFADMKGFYTVRKASGVKFDQSMHLFFDFNKQAFRWIVRVGGQTLLDGAVVPQFGSNTKSHFVALAERA